MTHASSVLVALVEDDESVRSAVERLLRASGMAVDVYASGTDFLNAVNDHVPDCVILDICMHPTGGPAVQVSLIERGFDLPIVFVSANDDAATRETVMRRGAAVFLQKPFSAQQLLSALENSSAKREGGSLEGTH